MPGIGTTEKIKTFRLMQVRSNVSRLAFPLRGRQGDSRRMRCYQNSISNAKRQCRPKICTVFYCAAADAAVFLHLFSQPSADSFPSRGSQGCRQILHQISTISRGAKRRSLFRCLDTGLPQSPYRNGFKSPPKKRETPWFPPMFRYRAPAVSV